MMEMEETTIYFIYIYRKKETNKNNAWYKNVFFYLLKALINEKWQKN